MNSKLKSISMLTLAGIIGSSVLTSYSLPSVFAAEKNVDHEYDLIEIQRNRYLNNADFEKGKTNWNIVGQNSNVVTDSETIGKSGKIGATTDPHANGHIWQEVTLSPNTKYTLKAKVKVLSENADDFVTLDVKKGGVNEAKYFKDLPVKANTKAWQDVELEFTTDEETKYTVGIGRWLDTATESQKNMVAYIDEVQISSETQETEENYEFVWADDFNENKLDTSKWGYELGCIRGVEQQHYTKETDNVFVDNGQLTLQITERAKEDQYKNPRGNRQVIYDSGSIRTHGKQEFLYGRIEIKAKLPKGKGVFPAFWTLGSDFTLDGAINKDQGQPWPVCGEVDIMELTGKESDSTPQGNQTVWQTLHYGNGADIDNGKYAGNGTEWSLPEGIFNDEYHVFGLNWSKGKMEWYVDDQIVRTVDYSDDPLALLTLDRPQYVQLNLAAGGNWPGDAGLDIARQQFNVDYIYYAQNEQQKADAEEYYKNAAKIEGVKDVTMYEGDIPDLLEGMTSTHNTTVDFSVENEHMFTNIGGNTKVELVCTGKDDTAKLAKLDVGQYNIHYSAIPNDENLKLNPYTRKSALLTVKERSLATDLENNGLKLEGYANDHLGDIQLPEGWTWDNPEEVLTLDMKECGVTFKANGFTKNEKVLPTVLESKTHEELQLKVDQATDKYINQTEVEYTKESLENLQNAIDNAEALLARKAPATYAEITQAYEAIDKAIEGLVVVEKEEIPWIDLKPATPIDNEELPWTDLKPATPTDNKQLPWTELKPATTTQNKEDNKVVQTSDTTSITMLMSTLFASSGALYMLKKRKHK